jgi:hypothetical protein
MGLAIPVINSLEVMLSVTSARFIAITSRAITATIFSYLRLFFLLNWFQLLLVIFFRLLLLLVLIKDYLFETEARVAVIDCYSG